MVENHQKFLLGEEGEHRFFMEVNWEDHERSNHCKLIKVTFPDGKETYVKREHIHSMLFAISNETQQAQIIPYKQETIRNLETMLGITATKNIQKGEKINVRVKIPIPLDKQEKIGVVPGQSEIIVPN